LPSSALSWLLYCSSLSRPVTASMRAVASASADSIPAPCSRLKHNSRACATVNTGGAAASSGSGSFDDDPAAGSFAARFGDHVGLFCQSHVHDAPLGRRHRLHLDVMT